MISSDVTATIQNGDLQRLRSLAETHGAESIRLEAEPEELTSLHLAAGAGQIEIVEYLLSESVKADPNATRINSFTPLHAAAMNGQTEICKALLNKGARVNAQTSPQGYAPLHSAAFGGYAETVQLLLAYGANPALLNYRNERPLETARRQNQSVVVKLLEEAAQQ